MSLCLDLLLFWVFTLLLLIWSQFQCFHAIKLGSSRYLVVLILVTCQLGAVFLSLWSPQATIFCLKESISTGEVTLCTMGNSMSHTIDASWANSQIRHPSRCCDCSHVTSGPPPPTHTLCKFRFNCREYRFGLRDSYPSSKPRRLKSGVCDLFPMDLSRPKIQTLAVIWMSHPVGSHKTRC